MSVVNQPRQLADVWMLQMPKEAPERIFLCNIKARQVVEADSSLANSLLDKRLEYRTKATFLITSRTWQLGDRRGSDVSVKLLQVQVHGQAPLAIALEVAYHPLSSCAQAAPVLQELSEALQGALDSPDAGRLDVLPQPWDDYAAWLPQEVCATHTAVLYVSLVVAVIRDRGQAVAAARKASQQQQQQQQQQQAPAATAGATAAGAKPGG